MDADLERMAKALVNQLLHGRMAYVPDGHVEISREQAAQQGLDTALLDRQGEYDPLWHVWLLPVNSVTGFVVGEL